MTTNNFTLNYNVTGNDRKRLADKMAEILGCEAKYLGVPTFNYVVDYFTIDKSGTVIFDARADSEEVENLIEQLEAAGFHAENEEDEDMTEVNVVVPAQELTAGQLRNIAYLAHAKQYLLNKVFGQEFWNIDDDLVQRLSDENPTERNDFLTIFEGFRSTCKGVSFDDSQVTLTYRSRRMQIRMLRCPRSWVTWSKPLQSPSVSIRKPSLRITKNTTSAPGSCVWASTGLTVKTGGVSCWKGLKATRPSVRPTTRPSGKLPEPQPVSARRPNRRPLLPLLRGSCFRL